MGQGMTVLWGFLVTAAVAIAVLVWLANYRSTEPLSQAAVTSTGYRIRRVWFWTITSAAVAIFFITIPYFPYPHASAMAAARHYQVVAQQYGFALPTTLPLNTPIIFDVTSKDVNHGFGIYDPHGKLVSQVQAMPEYVNHLPVTFATPGHYTIRCLEYCGIAHAVMQGGFDVR